MEEIKQQIREICTTLKENGGYYNLSEEQFEKLFALFEERDASLIAEIEKMKPDIVTHIHECRVQELGFTCPQVGYRNALDDVLALIKKGEKING